MKNTETVRKHRELTVTEHSISVVLQTKFSSLVISVHLKIWYNIAANYCKKVLKNLGINYTFSIINAIKKKQIVPNIQRIST